MGCVNGWEGAVVRLEKRNLMVVLFCDFLFVSPVKCNTDDDDDGITILLWL